MDVGESRLSSGHIERRAVRKCRDVKVIPIRRTCRIRHGEGPVDEVGCNDGPCAGRIFRQRRVLSRKDVELEALKVHFRTKNT